MTNQELTELVEEISLTYFKKPFLHQAFFNRRLKTTGGRYHLKDHHLDFNPLVFEKYGKAELISVIKHELCHYHLHIAGRGYQHKDADFKRLLKATGGARYAKPLAAPKSLFCYQCASCQTPLYRQRKVDTKKYVCGRCRGKLIFIGRKTYDHSIQQTG
ncbi:SprT family protein [Enterococcus sp. LJL120]